MEGARRGAKEVADSRTHGERSELLACHGPEHLALAVRSLERLGISGLVIEDKTGLKDDSPFGGDRRQAQDPIESFANKIQAGTHARVTEDFLVMARIACPILNHRMDDALRRAQAYIDAGADGIMIDSWQRTAAEILAFCEHYGRLERRKPLVVAPSGCSSVYERELESAGANVVVYAAKCCEPPTPR